MSMFCQEQKIENNIVSVDTQNLSQGMYICKVSEIAPIAIGAKEKKQSGALMKRVIVQH